MIYVKDMVYRTKVLDITDIQHRITEATTVVAVDMLIRTWREIERRLNILSATYGANVEVYWYIQKLEIFPFTIKQTK